MEKNLPNKQSYKQYTGYPELTVTEDGETEISMLNEAYDTAKLHFKYNKIAKWACFIIGFCFWGNSSTLCLGIILILVGIIVFTKKGVWGKKIQAELDAANNRYWKYFDKLAGYTAQNVFGENSGFRWNCWA